MFMKNLLLITLCATIPWIASANDGQSLLDPDFVKKFLPPQYHNTIASKIGELKNALGSGGSTPVSASPGTLGGLTGQINTQTPLSAIPMPPAPPSYIPPNVAAPTGGSFNPYMPTSALTQSFSAPAVNTQNVSQAPMVNTTLPIASSGNMRGTSNPFTNPQPVQVNQAPRNIVLKADMNANPVFHPPMESSVPQYPPVEGQHWYQYVLVDESVNPLA